MGDRLTALVADFEARTTDPRRTGLPLIEVPAALKAAPTEAAEMLRLLRAWWLVWAPGGTRPPPLAVQELDLQSLSAEAKAELSALAQVGALQGPVPTAGGARDLPGSGWQEQYIGGSLEAEEKHHAKIASQIREMQALGATDGRLRRAFHLKGRGLKARFTVRTDLAPELQVGLFRPGATWDAVVRLSNAASPDDREPNLHGLAVRILAESKQDFLCTSAAVSHVENAADQAQVGAALAHGTLKGALKLLFSRGPIFTLRVLGTLSKQTKKRATSLATLSYFSRAPFRFGPIAARFAFRPLDAAPPTTDFTGAHHLEAELTTRLKAGPVRWEMYLQRFVSEAKTPIEQGDSDWTLADSPAEPVGVLEIESQDLDAAAPEALAREVEGWAFSPLTTAHHTPLGRLNRGRKVAYDASVAGRGAQP